MLRPLSVRRARPIPGVLALLALAAVVAACGGSGGVPSVTTTPAEPAAEASAEATAPAGTPDAQGDVAPLAALVPAASVQAALGETPVPACDTSVLTGAGTCVWTAADGSWLKVEDGTPQEMPDLDSFTTRVTGTLGLDQPVEGLGEAAFSGTSSRGTRIAVFIGEGRVVWVVLNKPGDSTPLVTEIATTLVSGL